MEMATSNRKQSGENRAVMLELVEARKAIEVSIAALAAEKRTDEDLRKLEQILADMNEHIGDIVECEKADLMFHLALAQATHNSILKGLLESVSSQMENVVRHTRRTFMYGVIPVTQQLWREHREIYIAIREQNAYLAQEKMKQHLFHVERVLIQFFR